VQTPPPTPPPSTPPNPPTDPFDLLRRVIAGLFLAGFVGIWIWIAIKLFRFDPTDTQPQLLLSTAFATVSGALSGTVGAGTAAVLGIEVQKIKQTGANLRQSVARVAAASPLIVAGVLAYLGVGILLIVAWLVKGEAAPDVVESFSIGALGWMGGAFVAVFAADPG
jgi:hypothetical protein